MEAADAGQAVTASADRSDEDSSPRPHVFVDGVVRHAEASGTAARRTRHSPFFGREPGEAKVGERLTLAGAACGR